MENSGYIKVFSGSFIVVQHIVSNLEAIGISPVIKDESESGRLAGFGSSVQGFQEVYVNREEVDEAREVVNTVTNDLDTSEFLA